VVALLALACAAPDPVGPMPKMSADRLTFFDAPWPSDDRVDPDGTIALGDFPDPAGDGLLSTWVGFGEQQVGFGTNAPIYVAFDGPLDLALLPSPEGSVGSASSLALVNVDPRSPWRFERVPVRWSWQDEPSSYQPGNVLAVQPLPGFPLRRATTYALVVTTGVAARCPEVEGLLGAHAELRDALPFLDIGPESVAAATVFTTTDPVEEMARMATFVREDIESPRLSLQLELVETGTHFDVYRAHYPTPRFTHGVAPYLSEGGGFEFQADGDPKIDGWDDMRLGVCVPKDLSSPPPGGWPSAINQHGTGGDFLSHCDWDDASEVAARLGAEGLITLGIEQPLHGIRAGGEANSDLANFNVLNPDSGISNFRQGALDAIYLARGLASQPVVFTLPDGSELPLDSSNVSFLGHSQGALTGGLATPFFGGDVRAAVISAGGGVIAITLQVRTDPIDFAATFASLLGFEEGEEVTPFHPTMAVFQTLAERTDPINYAPYWFAEAGGWPGQAPTSVLLTNGTEDSMTPYETAIALAAAARLEPVGDLATSADALRMRGLPEGTPIVRDDAPTFEGGRVTAGFAQFRGGSHFTIWEIPEAGALYERFLGTAAEGAPELVR
jgi:hypothetical protein